MSHSFCGHAHCAITRRNGKRLRNSCFYVKQKKKSSRISDETFDSKNTFRIYVYNSYRTKHALYCPPKKKPVPKYCFAILCKRLKRKKNTTFTFYTYSRGAYCYTHCIYIYIYYTTKNGLAVDVTYSVLDLRVVRVSTHTHTRVHAIFQKSFLYIRQLVLRRARTYRIGTGAKKKCIIIITENALD